jgi:DNA replication protein DnaC
VIEQASVERVFKSWQERAREWEALPPEEKRKREAAQAKREAEQLEAERAEERNERLSAVEPRYRGANVFGEAAQDWLRQFLAGGDRGLLICGPTNSGKTHLLWGLFREVVKADGPGVEYVRLVRLLSRLRPGGYPSEEYVDRLCWIPLLLLDDIGAHKGSEWVDERLYEIIDVRYSHLRPVVATSNLRPEKLKHVIGERVARRLMDTCDLLVLDKRQ